MSDPSNQTSRMLPSDDHNEGLEVDYALEKTLIGSVRAAIIAVDATGLDRILDPLHPADIADLLEQISEQERRSLLSLWSMTVSYTHLTLPTKA